MSTIPWELELVETSRWWLKGLTTISRGSVRTPASTMAVVAREQAPAVDSTPAGRSVQLLAMERRRRPAPQPRAPVRSLRGRRLAGFRAQMRTPRSNRPGGCLSSLALDAETMPRRDCATTPFLASSHLSPRRLGYHTTVSQFKMSCRVQLTATSPARVTPASRS